MADEIEEVAREIAEQTRADYANELLEFDEEFTHSPIAEFPASFSIPDAVYDAERFFARN